MRRPKYGPKCARSLVRRWVASATIAARSIGNPFRQEHVRGDTAASNLRHDFKRCNASPEARPRVPFFHISTCLFDRVRRAQERDVESPVRTAARVRSLRDTPLKRAAPVC